MQDIPRGVSFEKRADGFIIRASCRSFVDNILQFGRAGLLSSLPFVIWPDLIRDLWYNFDGSPGYWLGLGFLVLWAVVIVYVDLIALISFAGDVRISKSGDIGKVLTGIGKLGWSRSFRWSSYSEAAAVKQQKSRSSFRSRGIELRGTTGRYKFGWLLPDERGEYVAQLLNDHAFAPGQRSDDQSL